MALAAAHSFAARPHWRQRALGLERLESRQLLAAEIVVELGGQGVADGTLLTAGPAGLQFGSVVQHQIGPTRTFTVRNTGDSNLTLGGVNLPDGFVLEESLNAVIAPGSSDTFTVRLETSNVGPKAGELFFVCNDLDETLYDFEIAGEVLEPPVAGAWQNPVDPLNVDGQPGVVPLDALIVINELNARTFTDPLTGALPAPTASKSPPPYYDVNGDGFVTPIDALRVINHLNAAASVASGEGDLGFAAVAVEGWATLEAAAEQPGGLQPSGSLAAARITSDSQETLRVSDALPLPFAKSGAPLKDDSLSIDSEASEDELLDPRL